MPVHHKRPFRLFWFASEANRRSNLVGLCQSCHMKIERNAILIDLDERNGPMAENRITGAAPLLAQVVRE